MNGQTEVTNKTIVGILKKKVGKKKGSWVYNLPKILWAYTITPKVFLLWHTKRRYGSISTRGGGPGLSRWAT